MKELQESSLVNEEIEQTKTKSKNKKGPWKVQEDNALREYVQKFGNDNWSKASSYVPGRTNKQCKLRWKSTLDPAIKKGDWTEEEDAIIFNLYLKLGTKWSQIAKHLPGRSDNAVKNRFHSTMRKLDTLKKKKTIFEEHKKILEECKFQKQSNKQENCVLQKQTSKRISVKQESPESRSEYPIYAQKKQQAVSQDTQQQHQDVWQQIHDTQLQARNQNVYVTNQEIQQDNQDTQLDFQNLFDLSTQDEEADSNYSPESFYQNNMRQSTLPEEDQCYNNLNTWADKLQNLLDETKIELSLIDYTYPE